MHKQVRVELLLQRVNHVFSSPSTSIPGATPVATHESEESTTKDVGKDVIHPRAAAATFPQTLLSISVIQLLLFRVAQHLIGKTDFFKLLRDGKDNGDFISPVDAEDKNTSVLQKAARDNSAFRELQCFPPQALLTFLY